MHAILFRENYIVKVSGCVLSSGGTRVDAVLRCCEDYKLMRAKACVGSEVQGILSVVTSHKGRQQPEVLTSELLGSNRGSKESVRIFFKGMLWAT